MPSSLRSVLFFRVYRETALPLYTELVAELCGSRQLPYQLATTLEDIGQGFMRLAEEVNGELARRGLLDREVEADMTVEAQIETYVARFFAAQQVEATSWPGEQAGLGSKKSLIEQALRIALTMVHDLPIAHAS